MNKDRYESFEKTTSTEYEYPATDKTNLDEMFTEIVNNLCRLDMKHTFTTEEFDEMLARLESLDKAVTLQITSLKYQVEAYKSASLKKSCVPAQA